jgi:cell division protease FtsH
MVTEFGMSQKLGRMFYSETSRSQFLGGQSGPGEVMHAEQTIREIDVEVKELLEQAFETALHILQSRRAVLDDMARELLEHEVMDAEHLKRVLDRHKTSPQISVGTYVTRAGVEHKELHNEASGEEEPPAPGTATISG